MTLGVGDSEESVVPMVGADGQEWFVLAQTEVQLELEGEHARRVVARWTADSGLVSMDGWSVNGGLPFGVGYSGVWGFGEIPPLPSQGLDGALAGMDVFPDTFGAVSLLVPHPIFRAACELVPGPLLRGLDLVDERGEMVLQLQQWSRSIRNDYGEEWESEFKGARILVRGDLLDLVRDRVTFPLSCVTVVQRKPH